MADVIKAARGVAEDATKDAVDGDGAPKLEIVKMWVERVTGADIPASARTAPNDDASFDAETDEDLGESGARQAGRGGSAGGQPIDLGPNASLVMTILSDDGALDSQAVGRAFLELADTLDPEAQDSEGQGSRTQPRGRAVRRDVEERAGGGQIETGTERWDAITRIPPLGDGGAFGGEGEDPGGGDLEAQVERVNAALNGMTDATGMSLQGHAANWALNLAHVGARHGLWSWIAIFLRELGAVGLKHGYEKVSKEATANWALGMMGATFAAHAASVVYTKAGGTATPKSMSGHAQNAAAMVATIITSKFTDILAPMAPIAAKAYGTAAIRDTGTLFVGMSNNLENQKEPSLLSMSIDSVIYALAQAAVGIPFYMGLIRSGNDPAALTSSFAENVTEAAKFASFLCIPEAINGLTYPLTTALWGNLLEDAGGGELPAWYLKLRMKPPAKPSGNQAAQHYAGVALARIQFIIMVNGILSALDTNKYISPDKLGTAGYVAVTAVLNAATCFFLYYPWIWQCMTKAPPEGDEAGFRLRRLAPNFTRRQLEPAEQQEPEQQEPAEQQEPPADQQRLAAERERRRQEIAAAEQRAIEAATKTADDDEAARQGRETERQAGETAKERAIAAAEKQAIAKAEQKATEDEDERKRRETGRQAAADTEERRRRDQERQAIAAARQTAIDGANRTAEAERKRLATERQRLAGEAQDLETERQRLETGQERLETDRQRLESERQGLEAEIAQQPEAGPEEAERRRLEAERHAAERRRLETVSQRLEIERQAAAKAGQQHQEARQQVERDETVAIKAAEQTIAAAGQKAIEDEEERKTRETARKTAADAEERRLRNEQQTAIAETRRQAIEAARQKAKDDEAERRRLDAAATQAAETERQAIEATARQAIGDARTRAKAQLATVNQGASGNP
ncbi:hypothetical protein AB4Z01_20215 [Inquilinus sp. YAF38]|uniref:hypothetical protein n=1 Tax=Inquilinus sp. YAF38 TaxID=3233084 RepID=UPI003F9013B0